MRSRGASRRVIQGMSAGSQLSESRTDRRAETNLTSHTHHDLRIVVSVFFCLLTLHFTFQEV